MARLGSRVGDWRRSPIVDALSRRGLLVATVALCALVLRLGVDAPPEASPQGVANMLGARIGGAVHPDEFVWEPSRGSVIDALFGGLYGIPEK